MIDKLDLRIPRRTPFTASFQRKYAELQALEKRPFRTSKLYEYTADLREYGHALRLNLFCQMDKIGNHKIELMDVGEMTRTEIMREVMQVFDFNPLLAGIMRVDFAVDVPDIPVQWFRETVHAERKRFRSAVTGEPFYSEMGTGGIQTLYFGKRPNLIRIYDKIAEYWHQYKTTLRGLGPDCAIPFEAAFPSAGASPIKTRVERQIGGRIPVDIATLGDVFRSAVEFNPFAKLKIIDHATTPPRGVKDSFETYCTGLFLRGIAEQDGMQAVKDFITKHSNGNTGWAWGKYRPFLPSATAESGITTAGLQSRFTQSFERQMSD